MTLAINSGTGSSVRLRIAAFGAAVSLLASSSTFSQEQKADPWMPWKDPNDPVDVHLMDPDDPTNAGWNTRRDASKDPQREPGLVNPQRYQTGFQSLYGFPTYFGAPMAFTTDDLKAGKVDVAVVGMAAENHIIPGARLAANVMRTLPDWMTFGADSFGTDQYLRTEYLVDLVIADYGNIAAHYTKEPLINSSIIV